MAEKKDAKPAKAGAAKAGAKTGAFKMYEAKGSELKRKNIWCPKCGPGFALANHQNRKVCGNCKYAEFSK